MTYKKLNKERIRAKVADIKENLQVLRNYSKQDREEFVANKEAVRSAKYAYIVMIEASSNIANHLCARLINTSPDSYAECFLLLGKHELISSKLSANLSKMAGFRNILVHGYKEIDDSKIYDFLQTSLDDLDLYLEELSLLFANKTPEGEMDENKN
ncbi:MAG: type VII toxin-antitoxin system HepT family RNase toxin [Bacillota bacterium]